MGTGAPGMRVADETAIKAHTQVKNRVCFIFLRASSASSLRVVQNQKASGVAGKQLPIHLVMGWAIFTATAMDVATPPIT